MTTRMFNVLWALTCLHLVACATPGRSDLQVVEARQSAPPVRDMVLNEPFEVVWDRLVRNMSSSFFVINNIDKASRLINVSMSSPHPEEFINCGKSHRTYSFEEEESTFDYEVAASSVYKSADKWGPYNNLPIVYEVVRQTALDGRINIYVAPDGAKATKVVVNARYIWTVQVSGTGTAYTAFGTAHPPQPLTPSSSTVSFNSAERGTSTDPKDPITCLATGKLESDILKMASKD